MIVQHKAAAGGRRNSPEPIPPPPPASHATLLPPPTRPFSAWDFGIMRKIQEEARRLSPFNKDDSTKPTEASEAGRTHLLFALSI